MASFDSKLEDRLSAPRLPAGYDSEVAGTLWLAAGTARMHQSTPVHPGADPACGNDGKGNEEDHTGISRAA
jgi:hypothetical protein